MAQAWFIPRVLKPAVFLAALLPLATLVRDAFLDRLGPNPVDGITALTGDWSLRLLLITLAVTPLRRLTGWNALLRMRRMLGLFAFFYVCLHFTTYLWLDRYLEFDTILEDVAKRPYITVGFTTFLLLVPLAATSTNGMLRRLGGRRWRKLHSLVYVAGVGGCLHYLWLVKADTRDPAIYLAILAGLLAARLPAVSRALSAAPPRLREWRSRRGAAAQPGSRPRRA